MNTKEILTKEIMEFDFTQSDFQWFIDAFIAWNQEKDCRTRSLEALAEAGQTLEILWQYRHEVNLDLFLEEIIVEEEREEFEKFLEAYKGGIQ